MPENQSGQSIKRKRKIQIRNSQFRVKLSKTPKKPKTVSHFIPCMLKFTAFSLGFVQWWWIIISNELSMTSKVPRCDKGWLRALDCPSSKGNQAPHPKFERPNGKNTKSKIFLKSVKN